MKGLTLALCLSVVVLLIAGGIIAWVSSFTPDGSLHGSPSKTPQAAVAEFINDFDAWKSPEKPWRTGNLEDRLSVLDSNTVVSGNPPPSVLAHFSHSNSPDDNYWFYLVNQTHFNRMETISDSSVSAYTATITTHYVDPVGKINYEYQYHLVTMGGGWLIDHIDDFRSDSKQGSLVKWDINSSQFIQSANVKEAVPIYFNKIFDPTHLSNQIGGLSDDGGVPGIADAEDFRHLSPTH